MPNNSTNFLANPIFLALVCVQIIIALLFSFTQKKGNKYQDFSQNIYYNNLFNSATKKSVNKLTLISNISCFPFEIVTYSTGA